MQPDESFDKKYYKVLELTSCLRTIESRISSRKEMSQTSTRIEPLSAHIDKLNLSFTVQVEKQSLIEQLINHGFKIKDIRLNGNKFFLEIYRNSGSFLLPSNFSISTCTTNPSHFKSWEHFKEDAEIVFGLFSKGPHKVSRLDLAVNYNGDFNEMKNDLIVSRVGSKSDFTIETSTSSKNTGVRYGKKPRQIELYNYALKHSKQSPEVRLEERLFNKKSPITDWKNLPSIISIEKFNGIRIEKHHLAETVSSLNSRTRELKTLIHNVGFMEAKKTLNRNGNFERNYSHFLEQIPYPETPEESFNRLIKAYFNNGEN